MDVEDIILLFSSSWIVLSAVMSKSIDVFLTLSLIGLLIALEIGSLFLSKEQKENMKPLIEILLVAFVIIVLKKVYEVLSG
ncbi:hypothetical protein PFDSM3638_02015 [Pyrococcus furiosus DSM 3638]|nr:MULTISPECIES: hypothetical protein [Pyrococcus]AFN03200.1 hypothetical protein PFC_01135 [Pyrococcus furiosus COM1]MDK2869259.1 hypothetical protein [Pyrococcus sp.]QEK78125.1 hypothetical protein PFDSM3638_02015 [Pyrococcus furiosus DSM 3638]